MAATTESKKRERWIDLGRHRIPNDFHERLVRFQQARCYPKLRDALIYLAMTALLSLPTAEEVELKDVEKRE